MHIGRRHLLRLFATYPLYRAARLLPFDPAPHYFTFFLHGLFFLRCTTIDNKDVLEVRAPKIPRHRLLGGARKNLQIIDGQEVDFTKLLPDLKPNKPTYGSNSTIPNEVKRSILQFTQQEAQLKFKPYNPSIYLGRVILPWPKEIYSLRADEFPYSSDPSAKIAGFIKTRCGGNKIGTVTCIQYPYHIPISYHLHLLHCDDENSCNVNSALRAAANVFEPAANFDFQIAYDMPPTPKDNNPAVPGVSADDENSAKEDDANWKKWCADLPPNPHECIENINPANGPLFFVG